jgi:hypothetical protein
MIFPFVTGTSAVPNSILVTSGVHDHDREAAAPSRNPADALGTALHRLRLDGSIFFRAEFTERWAYQSPTPDQMTQILRPDAKRLIIFHIVAAGSCWVQAPGGERLWHRRHHATSTQQQRCKQRTLLARRHSDLRTVTRNLQRTKNPELHASPPSTEAAEGVGLRVLTQGRHGVRSYAAATASSSGKPDRRKKYRDGQP